MRSDLWTEEEFAWLKDNYDLGIDTCAAYLGRSYRAVSYKLYQLRLSSTGRPLRDLVPYEKAYIPRKESLCKIPVFHPVMLGIEPSGSRNGRMWKKRRAIILKMHDYCCAYCGDEANTVDHIIPVDKGGLDNPENLVACCLTCNSSFGNKTKHLEFKIDTRSDLRLYK